jgi:hypothetical protein
MKIDSTNYDILKDVKWRVIREGHCDAINDKHCIVTLDWIQKCAFCGYRKWLGLL